MRNHSKKKIKKPFNSTNLGSAFMDIPHNSVTSSHLATYNYVIKVCSTKPRKTCHGSSVCRVRNTNYERNKQKGKLYSSILELHKHLNMSSVEAEAHAEIGLDMNKTITTTTIQHSQQM